MHKCESLSSLGDCQDKMIRDLGLKTDFELPGCKARACVVGRSWERTETREYEETTVWHGRWGRIARERQDK